MATWDATFENKPAGGDAPSTLDNEQRNHRKAVEERMANEHDTYIADSTVGNKAKDWVHKEGSAMAYYESAEPTNQPNGETLATRDAGRFWWDSDDDELRCYDGTDMQTIKKISGALEVTGGINNGGTLLKTKVVDIGDWNMNSTTTITVAHTISDFKKIRDVSAIIRNDADAIYYKLNNTFSTVSGGNSGGSVTPIDATTIELTRTTGGSFDGGTFAATTYNRGWITITYEG